MYGKVSLFFLYLYQEKSIHVNRFTLEKKPYLFDTTCIYENGFLFYPVPDIPSLSVPLLPEKIPDRLPASFSGTQNTEGDAFIPLYDFII